MSLSATLISTCVVNLNVFNFPQILILLFLHSVCSCADESSTVQCLNDNFRDFIGPFGILLFLYSVILTKVMYDNILHVSVYCNRV